MQPKFQLVIDVLQCIAILSLAAPRLNTQPGAKAAFMCAVGVIMVLFWLWWPR